MNSAIIEQFNLLVKQIEAETLNAQVENDVKEMNMHKFRLQSVKNALRVIKKLDFEITDASDVKGLPGIGAGTIKRIKEILETGTLSEIKNKYTKSKQAKIDSIQELEKIIGVGSAIAKKLVTKNNIRSVSDLKKAIANNKIIVSEKVLLGLKYYGVVEGNIPRKEISITEKYLRKIAHEIDDKLEIMICGSYRRGKSAAGDIDVMMYHPKVKTTKQIIHPEKFGLEPYLVNFIDKLTDTGFLLDHMTDKNYNMKYMGFSKFKDDPVRRIDIRFMPMNSLATAMLYFTGPYELNTAMRNAAKKRSMLLNEYGLYKIDKNNENDVRILIKTDTEADVFKALGMEYMTPEERESFSTGKLKKTKDES